MVLFCFFCLISLYWNKKCIINKELAVYYVFENIIWKFIKYTLISWPTIFHRKMRNIWPCNLIRPCLNTEYKWAHVSQYIETQRPWDCRIIWLQYYRAIIIWHPRRMEPFWPQTLRTMETFWPWDHTLYGSMCQEPKKYKVSTSGLCQGETFVAFHTFYHLIWHLFKWKFPIFFFFLFLFQRLNSFEKKVGRLINPLHI